MPRVSKRNINRAIHEDLREQFSFLITSLRSAKETEKFFDEFLSEEEKVMIIKRLMLHLMLHAGYKISDIGTVLGVSRETIRTHKHIWSRGNPEYIEIISKIARREKTKQFWNRVQNILNPH